MIETLVNWDKTLFLYLNGMHFDLLDPVMAFLSNNFIIFLLALIIFLFDYAKKKGLKLTLISFLFLFAGAGLSDLISTRIFKDNIKRARPCYTEDIRPQVHSVGSCYGGRYGFVSSHASNTMALAALLLFLAVRRKRVFKLLIVYSFLVSYSRIYVGKHYPLDVIFGMLLGYLIAYLLFRLHLFLLKKNAI